MSKYNTIPALDGLRGIASFFVVMCHLQLPDKILADSSWVTSVKELGWIGVPLYFVLSGYLITWLALNEKKITGDLSLRFFFLRRILRLWPIYTITVILGLWASSCPSLDAISSTPEWALPLATFTTNIGITMGMQHFGVLGAYWTLALEEQFYVLSGISLKYLSPQKITRLCWIVLGCCFIWRLYPLPFSFFLHYRIQPPVSFASIIWGCLLALSASKIQPYFKSLQNILSFFAILGLIFLAYFELPFPVTSIGACALMTAADLLAVIFVILALGNSGIIYRFFCLRPLTYLGKISLCMYAVNLPIIYFYGRYKYLLSWLLPNTESHLILSTILDIVVVYSLIIFVSVLWDQVDAPITALRHRYRPNKAAQHPVYLGAGYQPDVIQF